jgi:ABC-type dipeptide/oligopeptide/nickel transport system permease subunit
MKKRKRMPLPVKASLWFIILLGLLAAVGPLLPLANPYAQNLMKSNLSPSIDHWLGTDPLGRDILSRAIAGTRYSFLIGLGAVGIGIVIGIPFGMLAGFYGRWVDILFARVIDVFLAFPGIILALAIVAVMGPGVGSLILAVGTRTIPVFARVARGQTLSIRQRDFVLAARALGCRHREILSRHILPNIAGPLMVIASLQIAVAILIGATLSFLGVGISPEIPEWGAMLNAGRPHMMRYPHLVLVPGFTLMAAMMALNVMGDYLRDYLDPHHQVAR